VEAPRKDVFFNTVNPLRKLTLEGLKTL